MIWRIRERRAFSRLAAEGQRARAGVLWCNFLLDPPDSTTPPRVAFALGRALGSAATRNRARRRLRAALSSAASAGRLLPGTYLFGARQGVDKLSSSELTFDLEQLLSKTRV